MLRIPLLNSLPDHAFLYLYGFAFGWRAMLKTARGFCPAFGGSDREDIERGVVSFPELGKCDGGFFALEGVCYFVPDDETGLPSDYEGRILAVTCEDADQAEPEVSDGSGKSDKAAKCSSERSSYRRKSAPKQLAQDAPDPCRNLFYDLPDETGMALVAPAQMDAPDLSLSASLRSAFHEPDTEEEVPPQRDVQEAQDLPKRLESPPLPLSLPAEKEAEIAEYFAPTSRELTDPKPTGLVSHDDDDWSVYLAPQPTIQSYRPAPQVIEIITEVPEAAPEPEPFDPAIDLVLAGEEKQTFALMAQEVVETVESFEHQKRAETAGNEQPLLIAELRKLDPKAPDKRPRRLLPWIKRNETEEEMIERLTIKTHRQVG